MIVEQCHGVRVDDAARGTDAQQKQKMAEAWDEEATSFDEAWDHGLTDPRAREAWWSLLSSVLPPAGARVADLGCGTGSLSLLLAEQGYHVDGIDLSPRMVELALAKTAAQRARVHIEAGDASAPDLPSRSYDAVVVRHVVWALPDPASALRRWESLLGEGGRLVLVEGRWSTGAGVTADELLTLLPPTLHDVHVLPLADPALWGRPIDDERYLVTARRGAAGQKVVVEEAVTPAQLEQVRSLIHAFVAWHRERHVEDLDLIDAYFDTVAFEAELATLPGPYSPPRGRLLLATLDGAPVGCVALKPLDEQACEMKRMFVTPGAQGQGVGRALAEALMHEAQACGYDTMWLDTSVRQKEAQGLYRSLGFRVAEAYYPLPDDLLDWLVFMRKDLKHEEG